MQSLRVFRQLGLDNITQMWSESFRFPPPLFAEIDHRFQITDVLLRNNMLNLLRNLFGREWRDSHTQPFHVMLSIVSQVVS